MAQNVLKITNLGCIVSTAPSIKTISRKPVVAAQTIKFEHKPMTNELVLFQSP